MTARRVIAGAALLAAAAGLAAPAASGADRAPGAGAARDGRAGDAAVSITRSATPARTVRAGAWRRIYDPSQGETKPFYVNDHTWVRKPGSGWHLFGITHPEPAAPLDEDSLAHAVSPQLTTPFTKRPDVLPVDPSQGEEHVWAPHVVRADGKWWMFYAGGDADHGRYRMQLATSTDLNHWTRYPGNPLFQDGYDARDPYVMRLGNRWVMYYTANETPTGGTHLVAYRFSRDLIHWGPRKVAYRDPQAGTFGGPTESPFVQRQGDDWYLSICCTAGYRGTKVLRSKDPLSFTPQQEIGRLDAHAAEFVRDERGKLYVSRAGWGQGGVDLAPVRLNVPTTKERLVVRAPGYRATLQTAPTTALTSLQVKGPDGWRETLDTVFRPTGPYAGVGDFGSTDAAGAAKDVEVDGNAVTLRDVPMGDEGLTVDWSLRFDRDAFDQTFGWHVTSLSAPAWELAWSLETALGFDRKGDVPGFPASVLATDGRTSLAAAYKPGSAFGTDNHWFGDNLPVMSWQPLWQPGGRTVAPGDLPGGTWRVGVSATGDDTALQQRLEREVTQP